MSDAIVKAALSFADTDHRTLQWYAERERMMVKAMREDGYFFFLGEKVYCVNADTGKLTNGEPLPERRP